MNTRKYNFSDMPRSFYQMTASCPGEKKKNETKQSSYNVGLFWQKAKFTKQNTLKSVSLGSKCIFIHANGKKLVTCPRTAAVVGS